MAIPAEATFRVAAGQDGRRPEVIPAHYLSGERQQQKRNQRNHESSTAGAAVFGGGQHGHVVAIRRVPFIEASRPYLTAATNSHRPPKTDHKVTNTIRSGLRGSSRCFGVQDPRPKLVPATAVASDDGPHPLFQASASYNTLMWPGNERDTHLTDRTAAAEIPREKSVRAWAREKRAFMSSVMEELHDERAAAADGVRSLGARPVMLHKFGGRDPDPQDAYLGEVETSQTYVGIGRADSTLDRTSVRELSDAS